MPQPARPDLVFHSLDEMIADADRLRRDGYDRAGKWDLPMILDHLTKAMLAEAVKKIPWPLSAVARMFIRAMVCFSYYPSFIRFHAPQVMKPAKGIAIEPAYAEFRAAVDKLKTWPTHTLRTPFGRMKLNLWIKLQLLHGAHHLAFLRPHAPAQTPAAVSD